MPRPGSNGGIRKERLMSLQKDTDGYLRIRLTDASGTRKTHKVHRLVAKSFILNPLDLPEVNHLDGDKSNNVFSNLEWSNRSLNVQHCYDNNLKDKLSLICDGEEISFRQLALKSGVKYTTAVQRLRAGWSIEDAATKPTRRGNYK